MTDYNNIPLQLPDAFKQYLKKFNCKSTVDIRKALNQKESWEDSYHQDKHSNLDWIKQSIHMLLQEYELDSFANDHSENWNRNYKRSGGIGGVCCKKKRQKNFRRRIQLS
ncbi:hypothetical protein INT46_007759 [Mucor plumbeus]|uniref:Uncharacterized protein n=1 Tax=Mucor plumbeus TaxID=97098 RepID=A0A8H7QH03_9FUNG|nr:hypothetical protein INT46_007759 [Mucor plumbeus]